MKPNDAVPGLIHELRSLAARLLSKERASHTLQPTALVNEAYLRIAGRADVNFENRAHLLRSFIQEMNRILIDHARGRNRLKRGGAAKRLGLEDAETAAAPARTAPEDDDILALNSALEVLDREDPQLAAVVHLRMFFEMDMKEIASMLGVCERTAYNDWAAARAKLRTLIPE